MMVDCYEPLIGPVHGVENGVWGNAQKTKPNAFPRGRPDNQKSHSLSRSGIARAYWTKVQLTLLWVRHPRVCLT
jgi:hypothetical protein